MSANTLRLQKPRGPGKRNLYLSRCALCDPPEPVVSAGGNFTVRSLAVATISSSYTVTRSCDGGMTGCPTVDNTVLNTTGSLFNLDPFGFSW